MKNLLCIASVSVLFAGIAVGGEVNQGGVVACSSSEGGSRRSIGHCEWWRRASTMRSPNKPST